MAGWNGSNAWAVGVGHDAAFSMHWNGSTWSKVPVPVFGQRDVLEGLAMASPHDVWGFGDFENAGGTERSLALHRTGGTWVKVATPNVGAGDNDLSDASVISPTDIWAIGAGTVGAVKRRLGVHWNGIRWNKVDFPIVPVPVNEEESITAVGPGDVWIALTAPDQSSGNDRAVTYHLVSGTWHRVNLTQPSHGNVDPTDLLAFGPSSIWMVGFFARGVSEFGLLGRWNGSDWVRFQGLHPDPVTNLAAVTGFGPHDVYAVGLDGTGSFVEHYDGNGWHQVATHDPAGADTFVLGGGSTASGSADHPVWAVGFTTKAGIPDRSLVEQSCPS